MQTSAIKLIAPYIAIMAVLACLEAAGVIEIGWFLVVLIPAMLPVWLLWLTCMLGILAFWGKYLVDFVREITGR